VQLRFETGLTSEDYVRRQAWREASLARCPLHPQGGCSLHRHGTYERKTPPGTHVARWYCPQGHRTFSLLPDCLAARWPGALVAMEAVVALAEQASSLEAAANAARPDDVGLVCAMRWVRRRRVAVHANLRTLKGLLPALLRDAAPRVGDVRRALATEQALETLRARAARHLQTLPPPLGFLPPQRRGGDLDPARQQRTGPDPPH
jgi:hypothetical protein